ncbi:MAG: hypothetical protein MUD01_15025 [Chloroflexaceae bacterium]|jgi:hypothetical protein|nr:hypothetical protein [Chloroflexaceae bacterium]
MSKQEMRLPIEVVTDPVMLWLFKHGFEDPGWGQTEVGQLTLNLVIHDLAGRITDDELRREIRGMTTRAVGRIVQHMMKA